MTEKLIIENQTDLPMIEILPCITEVIRMGRISNNNTEYCYGTRFTTKLYGVITVFSHKNKKSDRLIVRKDK